MSLKTVYGVRWTLDQLGETLRKLCKFMKFMKIKIKIKNKNTHPQIRC